MNSFLAEEVGGNLDKKALQDAPQLAIGLVLLETLSPRLLVKTRIVRGVDFYETEHLPVREIVVGSALGAAQLDCKPIVVGVAIRLNAYAVPVDVQTADLSCLLKHAGMFFRWKGRMPRDTLEGCELDVERSAFRATSSPAAPVYDVVVHDFAIHGHAALELAVFVESSRHLVIRILIFVWGEELALADEVIKVPSIL